MSACASPLASRSIASWRWCGVSDCGRPNFTPRAFARVLPSLVRARISSRSNSAKPPKTVNISRPCGVVVSAQASPNDLKPAPALAITSRILSRSRVDRANRSSRVTTRTSPRSRLKFGRPAALTPHQRREAVERLTKGEAQADIARSYAVSQSTISRLAAPGPFEASAAGA
jgi:hypothetical protein